MAGAWRVYLVSGLISLLVTIGTTLVMSRLVAIAPSNIQTLEGEADVPWGVELEVFYKTPFASPPYLTFPEGLESNCKVMDQKPASFRLVRAQGGMAGNHFPNVKWKAEGQPVK
jgi:hypothetical protein